MAEKPEDQAPKEPRLRLFSDCNLIKIQLLYKGTIADLKNISYQFFLDGHEYYITKNDLKFKNIGLIQFRFSAEEWLQIHDDAFLRYSSVYKVFQNEFKMQVFQQQILVNRSNYLIIYSFIETKKGECKMYIDGAWRVSASRFY